MGCSKAEGMRTEEKPWSCMTGLGAHLWAGLLNWFQWRMILLAPLWQAPFQKGQGLGTFLWPKSRVADVLSGPRTSGWKKRSCPPDVSIAQTRCHLEPVKGDNPAHWELFVDLASLGSIKSGSWFPGTAPHIMESSGPLLPEVPPESNSWRAFLRISLSLCSRGFSGSQMISDPNLHMLGS